MTIEGTNGNVGIGTSTPANKLSVAGNADFTGNVGIGTTTPSTPLAIMGNGGTTPVGITQNAVGGASTMELTTTDSAGNQATRIVLRGSDDTPDIEFYTGASGSEAEVMHIEGTNGNVGIGTNTPTEALEVVGTVTATSFVGDGSGLTGLSECKNYITTTRGMESGSTTGGDFPDPFCPAGWTLVTSWTSSTTGGFNNNGNENYNDWTETLCSLTE